MVQKAVVMQGKMTRTRMGTRTGTHAVSSPLPPLHTRTKLPQHMALPEDPPSLPRSNDPAGLNSYTNLDPVIIDETRRALNGPSSGWPAIHHTSSPEPAINTSSQGPALLSTSSHAISGVHAPSGPPSSPPPPPSHAYSTPNNTRALEDAVRNMAGATCCSSRISSARTSLLSAQTASSSDLHKE